MVERVKNFYKQISFFIVIVFTIRCFFSLDSIINEFSLYNLFGYISDSITISSFMIVLYERVLWRANPFESVPKLHKSYSGTIISSFDGKCRNATLTIRQTLLSIHISQTTEESRSQSINASIIDLNGEKCIVYTYLNTPNALVRERSSIHYGTATLCIEKKCVNGDYFTDRKTTGIMNFTANIK